MPDVESFAPGTPSYVDIGVPDFDAASAFYGGLFGWDVVDLGPEAGGYRMAELGGRGVAGIGPQQGPGTWWTSYVTVVNVDETLAKVTAAGGSVLMPAMDVMTAGRMAIFTDPTGAALAVWEPGDSIGSYTVNEPGTLCWNELNTRDVDAAKAFYSAVFGWTPVTSQNPEMEYTEWHLDGRSIGGMMSQVGVMPDEVPPHWLVYFAVADCDATLVKAVELGGTKMTDAMDIPGTGRFALVGDPFGAHFAVMALESAG